MLITAIKKASELTQQQKNILANAANFLGFTLPIIGKGIRTFKILESDIEGVYLYPNSTEYEVKTKFGSNFYDRETFKSVVEAYKN